jgi:uncharacterized Zn-finger protein
MNAVKFQKNCSSSFLFKCFMTAYLFVLITAPAMSLENGSNEESVTAVNGNNLVQDRFKLHLINRNMRKHVKKFSKTQCRKGIRCNKHPKCHPEHNCHTCHKCQTGPTGHTGQPGFFNNNLCSYTSGDQLITNGSPQTIEFDTDLVPSGTITRSANQFTIGQDGTYLIGWTLSAVNSNQSRDLVNISLVNVSTSSTIPPNPNLEFVQGKTKAASGQTIVSLPAGTIIKLQIEVVGASGGTSVQNPIITFEQVGFFVP